MKPSLAILSVPAVSKPVEDYSYQAAFAQLSACRRLLEEISSGLQCKRISQYSAAMDIILQLVAHEFEMPAELIHSRVRSEPVSLARHVAIFLIFQNIPGIKKTEIARWFKRDHGSIFHAISCVTDRCSIDDHLARRVLHLQTRVRTILVASPFTPPVAADVRRL